MRYQVIHDTHYSYEAPVALSQQLLHLTPRALGFQQLEQHRVDFQPEPSETVGRQDYFGNPVTQIVLAKPHSALSVRAESLITVDPRAAPGSDAPWENMREQLHRSGSEQSLAAAEFLFESPHVECFRDLATYAGPSFPPGRGLVEAALDFTRRIHADFKFDPKATSVSTPLREVLTRRRGVCQDFAHLMTGCLRTLGIAARYVSGYILTTPPPGKPRLVGADASHAWVSVYCAGAGEAGSWIDF